MKKFLTIYVVLLFVFCMVVCLPPLTHAGNVDVDNDVSGSVESKVNIKGDTIDSEGTHIPHELMVPYLMQHYLEKRRYANDADYYEIFKAYGKGRIIFTREMILKGLEHAKGRLSQKDVRIWKSVKESLKYNNKEDPEKLKQPIEIIFKQPLGQEGDAFDVLGRISFRGSHKTMPSYIVLKMMLDALDNDATHLLFTNHGMKEFIWALGLTIGYARTGHGSNYIETGGVGVALGVGWYTAGAIFRSTPINNRGHELEYTPVKKKETKAPLPSPPAPPKLEKEVKPSPADLLEQRKDELTDVLEKCPDKGIRNSGLRYELGVVCYQLHLFYRNRNERMARRNLDCAFVNLLQSLDNDPSNRKARHYLVMVLQALGRHDKARRNAARLGKSVEQVKVWVEKDLKRTRKPVDQLFRELTEAEKKAKKRVSVAPRKRKVAVCKDVPSIRARMQKLEKKLAKAKNKGPVHEALGRAHLCLANFFKGEDRTYELNEASKHFEEAGSKHGLAKTWRLLDRQDVAKFYN